MHSTIWFIDSHESGMTRTPRRNSRRMALVVCSWRHSQVCGPREAGAPSTRVAGSGISSYPAKQEPTKPTEPGFDGFVGSLLAESAIDGGADSSVFIPTPWGSPDNGSTAGRQGDLSPRPRGESSQHPAEPPRPSSPSLGVSRPLHPFRYTSRQEKKPSGAIWTFLSFSGVVPAPLASAESGQSPSRSVAHEIPGIAPGHRLSGVLQRRAANHQPRLAGLRGSAIQPLPDRPTQQQRQCGHQFSVFGEVRRQRRVELTISTHSRLEAGHKLNETTLCVWREAEHRRTVRIPIRPGCGKLAPRLPPRTGRRRGPRIPSRRPWFATPAVESVESGRRCSGRP